jgi:molybdopterin-dependent oxidoreductase alpha subunit
MGKPEGFEEREHHAGGWGSVKALGSILLREHIPLEGSRILLKQNKPDGYACVSCSWAKPADPKVAEFCEEGAKATAWEITHKKLTPEFFGAHTLAELRTWHDHDLEEGGRLTAPMRWDASLDKYVEVSWDKAFAEIGAELKKLDPESVVLYTSGRASLEAAYMYQLFARMYGTNNLPDSSNMCHESTSVALPKTIGVGVGTVNLDDFRDTDCIFFFGQNVGVNSPRMLHQLKAARERGVPIVTFNPLREPGLVSFADPQSPKQMLTGSDTRISTQYHQVSPGGDTAVLMGLCKVLIEIGALDTAFIEQHTHGFEEFAQAARSWAWSDIERESDLPRAAIEEAAQEYARASAAMVVYGMGLTQHRKGVLNVQMVSNLLLLRGNMGKPGAGICPVRGHSNVQGQRTVGITEKPELAPLDKLKALYRFEPPREKGLNTVETCEGVLDGRVKAFIGLGGNFVRAVPERGRMEAAWTKLRLTVQIATKLNRSHLVHGEISYLLPCLGRIEIDRQASGEQAVSMESSIGHMHGSKGAVEPASESLRSEPAIVAGIAKATLAPNPAVPWDEWVADYSRVREAIAKTYPDIFHDFNARMWTPGGFPRPLGARERVWKTPNGKANFITPKSLAEDPDMPAVGPDVLRLTTIRSIGQFNTTIYDHDDRYRGIEGTRMVLLANRSDLARLGLHEGDVVTAVTVAHDGVNREVRGLRIVPYDVPNGCIAGYYPECNPLIPLWHHAEGSKVPAAKSIPVRLRKEAA